MNCDEECVPSSPIITNELINATFKRLGITDRFIDVAFLIFFIKSNTWLEIIYRRFYECFKSCMYRFYLRNR